MSILSDLAAGPLLFPGAPFTPGPELVEEAGLLSVEVSAAKAGAAVTRMAKPAAVIIFFMAYVPSFLSFFAPEQRRQCEGVPDALSRARWGNAVVYATAKRPPAPHAPGASHPAAPQQAGSSRQSTTIKLSRPPEVYSVLIEFDARGPRYGLPLLFSH